MMSCNNDSGLVAGDAPVHYPAKNETTTVASSEILFGAYFDIINSNLYELLMASCRRCGLKRFHTSPFGGVTYQRIYDIFNNDIIQKCDNWTSSGYMQIKFDSPKLPTTASITIKPKSNKRDPFNANSYIWGEAFTIKGTAQPINENNGFNLRLFPSDGLGGTLSLIIRSSDSNHVKKDELNVDVTYGSNINNEDQVISADLIKLQSPAVTSQFTCDQYTN